LCKEEIKDIICNVQSHTSDDVPCKTEIHHAIMEGHGIGVVEPATASKAALNAVFVYI
jgi:hypothetical protein